jgi:ferredoxin--NADP+ reductase
MGIPGEDLAGCYSARDFVAWYNGHPDQADTEFGLDSDRVVVIGNGNVALDVARTLLLPERVLRSTDMSDVAIDVITAANVREVVVVARRGPEHAAYSLGELMALEKVEGVTIAVDPKDIDGAAHTDRRHDIIRRAADQAGSGAAGQRTIRLRFGLQPVAVNGADRVESITFRDTAGHEETVDTSTVLRAIGYRGLPVDGLPFDPVTATLPNDAGRVVSPDTDLDVPGVYCTGWIKRGSRGIIGTNKVDAGETVDSILRDLSADRLDQPTSDLDQLRDLLVQRQVDVVDKAAWRRIDRVEKTQGAAEDRPRKKLLRLHELMHAAREEP